MQRSVLVTGVAGFVGSNLAKRLLDSGHQLATRQRAPVEGN